LTCFAETSENRRHHLLALRIASKYVFAAIIPVFSPVFTLNWLCYEYFQLFPERIRKHIIVLNFYIRNMEYICAVFCISIREPLINLESRYCERREAIYCINEINILWIAAFPPPASLHLQSRLKAALLAMNCALCQANSGENVVFLVAIAKAWRNSLWAIAMPMTLGGLPAVCSR